MTREKCVSIIKIIRLLTPKNIDHSIDVFNIKLCSIVVVRTNRSILSYKWTYIFHFRCDDVEIRNGRTDRGIIKKILLLSLMIKTLVDYLSIDILRMTLRIKVEITAIVAEANIVGIDILPSPILRCQFAIH